MNVFRNLNLKWKLSTGFAVPVLLIIGISTLVYQATHSLVESARWVNHTHEAIGIGNRLGAAMIDMETGLRGYIITGKEEFLEPYERGQANFSDTIAVGQKHVSDNPSQINRLGEVDKLKTEWLREHAHKAIKLRKQANSGEISLSAVTAFIEQGHGKNRMDKLRLVLGGFIEAEAKLIELRSQEADSLMTNTTNIAFFGAFFAVCAALLTTIFISRSIVQPVESAGELANSIAKGNLNNQINIESSDEVGKLLQALAAMQEKLRGLVDEISGSANSVLDSSKEIARGNNSLSERTEKQATSLEETAASMEEMTSSVKMSAEHADSANQIATNARQQAESGSDVVRRAVKAMEEINSSSGRIADIIAVIDEIAFQTNLLALNAAVEAARAGEQGRGFAVVATEVRNLAQRSATSAKEIKELIQDSVEKVEEGSKLVFESGQTLDEILGSVADVSKTVAEITVASREQRLGIEQVNKAVVYIDEMTQKNSAMVEEAASASETMITQAKNLNQLVSFFDTDDNRYKKTA
ncbi:MAG: methyl-accepting chemotaxis protein [Granulosicoccaceae bacterium]